MSRRTSHGDIYWASIDKRRPVLVVSRDDERGVRRRTTVATITTRVRSIPVEVPVGPTEGLEHPSVVNCDELATLDKDRLGERIGRLSPRQIDDLHRALTFALAIS